MTGSSQRLAGWILAGMVFGLVTGALVCVLGASRPGLLDFARQLATAVLDPIGKIFLHLLFIVVIPLVFSTLSLGVVQLGKLERLGPLAGRTALLFGLNMIIGVILGLVAMNIFEPGNALSQETKAGLLAEFGGKAGEAAQTSASRAGGGFGMFVDMLLPRNFLKSLVEFQILPLIVLALLTGVAGTQLAEDRRHKLQQGLEIVAELMIRIVRYAMWLAPVAVPALIFSVLVKAGLEVIYALGGFVCLSLGVMSLHLFGTLSVWIKLLARRSPLQFFKALRTVMVTAFSTSSSAATLPTSLQTCRDFLGLSPSVSGFVLPLGATLNMSGTALYEGCVVLFIAQIYGVNLALGSQITLVFLAVLSAVAVAGIPGGSLPLIAGLLFSFGVPPEGLAVIIGVDRILDMARTTLNVSADIVTAAVVDRQTGGGADAQPAGDTPAG